MLAEYIDLIPNRSGRSRFLVSLGVTIHYLGQHSQRAHNHLFRFVALLGEELDEPLRALDLLERICASGVNVSELVAEPLVFGARVVAHLGLHLENLSH